MGLSDLFIDPDTLPDTGYGLIQLLFLLIVYGFILFKSSDLISNGSELLLLIPSLAGIVGSVVLPILGAVPDGAIVLFSGMGPDAQKQLSVGVGALAGSTIMLLTIPWGLAIIAGRVNLDEEGNGNYRRPDGYTGDWQKLTPGLDVFNSGVNCKDNVKMTGKIMILTGLSYALIQGPAFALNCGETHEKCHGAGEKYWALAGTILCLVFFIGYLVYQIKTSGDDEVRSEQRKDVQMAAMKSGQMNFSGVFFNQIVSATEAGGAVLDKVLREYFNKIDTDRNGSLDKTEVKVLLGELHEDPNNADVFMAKLDTDQSGTLSFAEFKEGMLELVLEKSKHQQVSVSRKDVHASKPSEARPLTGGGGVNYGTYKTGQPLGDLASERSDVESARSHTVETADDDEDGEEDEIPEDLLHLTPEQQQTRIKLRSAWMMGLGTLTVLLFSDPMVDVLAKTGERIGVSSFYISFVLAPLASNASELLAGYNYAIKKTKKSVSISFATLQGAACMNNTFCLGIFLALIYGKSLVWEFSAETASILFVEVLMLIFSLKTTHRVFDAFLVFSLYPLSLLLVWGLEKMGFN
eukprot:CAMPEP_0114554066 /NCGR_PEP_ID=MMETSP0114-20121206/8007_1 /TAXON_ID=31324 /ORGANISM="Goniomonas sp, Strain m" /LENGTH=577 /DNA_ID=CAMNT_0001739079 /DNA_START=21 /DNA_END=1754 /DNA_ORIENTATION=+